MEIEIGDFFDIFVLKESVENSYPNGVDGITNDVHPPIITENFLCWGTMGSDNTISNVISALENAGLNCDYDDRDCVYIQTSHRRPPTKERNWLGCSEKDGKNWLYKK